MKRIAMSVAFSLLMGSLITGNPLHAGNREYHGNIRSYVFHQSSCRYFNCKNCIKIFNSRQEAIEAGYRPCKKCHP